MIEEKTLGGEAGKGQDVSIILVPMGTREDQKVALIHLHSHALSTHSKYFNTCLSERWQKLASPSTSMEFVLEVQTDVQYYFDCFSAMYPPFVKTFEGVKHGVELLKVASQIDFQELMERISLYLSTMFWSKEDKGMIQEYSASPDFPRIHLQDLVSRLGLDESKEERQKELCEMIQECSRAIFNLASTNERVIFPKFVQGIGCGLPSDISKMVIEVVSQEAMDMFANIAKRWRETDLSKVALCYENIPVKVKAMNWILEALLDEQVAEELVRGIVHFDAIPTNVGIIISRSENYDTQMKRFANLVLRMYKEVAAGHLLLRPPERLALLANWHVLMKSKFVTRAEAKPATENLFLTLPLKQQRQLVILQKENIHDYIDAISLISMVSEHHISFRPSY